jgi:hypothetical protein
LALLRMSTGKVGSGGRIRTYDQRINSTLLERSCNLSKPFFSRTAKAAV